MERSLGRARVDRGDGSRVRFGGARVVEITGHIDYARSPPVLFCKGTIEPAEAERITAAVNGARLFCHGDVAADRNCIEWVAEDVSIQTTDGTRANRFCLHGPCPFARPARLRRRD